ncbi:MAG: ComF family protein [Dissulfurimicrobium sp.]|uniref:ComF family protein n=1 Tax=Dissulfurimicrobium sp. TaxID=2022436 RepID=UPI0040498A6D
MNLKDITHAALKTFGELIFPPLCAACGARLIGTSQGSLCTECLAEIKDITSPLCTICGAPFISRTGIDHVCEKCLRDPPFFTKARAAFEYSGPVRTLIKKIKFQDDRYALKTICQITTKKLMDISCSDLGLLVPVPLHNSRLRQRGFNQALELAKGIFHGLPIDIDLLVRHKKTPPQTGLDEARRLRNVEDAFYATCRLKKACRKVTIIDDIFTTGSTVNACAKALKKAGVEQVEVFTIARTIKKTSFF